jgi:hypothetical protein
MNAVCLRVVSSLPLAPSLVLEMPGEPSTAAFA